MSRLLQQTRQFLMQQKWLFGIALVLALAFMGLVSQPTSAGAAFSGRGNPFTLAGTWQHQVGGPDGFVAYETFTEAGGSVEINNGPGGPTTGIGTWTRIDPRTFLGTLYKQQFDAAGNHASTTKVRRLFQLDESGDSLTGIDNVDIYDPVGNLLFSPPPGFFTSIRLGPDPLNQ